MNWDDLKILLSLSRYGSTRKAAAQLGVSNTTVMRRLDGLEEALAGKLFDRTPDGFQATALAAELLVLLLLAATTGADQLEAAAAAIAGLTR